MKKICKLDKKETERFVRELLEDGRRPRYICEACARLAFDRKQLCKPLRIRKKSVKKR
ncbi:conserved hypothetical protein [Chlorobium phaeobacteroides DSM 266]|jgi:hypothetical protein|uniref:Uncharacterized protein n=1 Tax=Chlorobium phaeobacteroides (strain DSM 266 / SMG 266 / 2430) TaxID=290317 RepID=A1BI04_CHLPD|nr:conserved hypothetical protein [Chlorobium phaeobacteroides DSM 266]